MKKMINYKEHEITSFVDIILLRSHSVPDKKILTYLTSFDEKKELTYKKINKISQQIAVKILHYLSPGDRALIFHKPSIDYITALFGCLYAGIIAIPVYGPEHGINKNKLYRLKNIIKDSGAKGILLSYKELNNCKQFFSNFYIHKEKIHYITTDDTSNIDFQDWKKPYFNKNNTSIIQYTSGSTSDPKGVMLNHTNLISNILSIQNIFEMKKDKGKAVIWLPPYHDMGLIGGILTPIFVDFPLILISPLLFIQNPIFWLKLISMEKATITGGPNFAFDLCSNKAIIRKLNNIDLSSIKHIFSGAEPINPEVINKFFEIYEKFGLSKKSFSTCYGLAESTLMVTSSKIENNKEIKEKKFFFKKNIVEIFKKNQKSFSLSKKLFSCGKIIPNHKLAIVDPKNSKKLNEKVIGEIYVKGPSVSKGYWKNPKKTKNIFQNFFIKENKKKSYGWLKTGDLGFLYNSQLYVTGRIKDLIIIRGENFYPQDIENYVKELNSKIQLCNSAAFEIDKNHIKEVVLLQEIRKKNLSENFENLALDIRKSILDKLNLLIHNIIFIEKGALPKTTSGKIQRFLAKKYYLSNSFNIIFSFNSQLKEKYKKINYVQKYYIQSLKKEEKKIYFSIIKFIKRYQNLNKDIINFTILEIGLDSLHIMELKNFLEEKYKIILNMHSFVEDTKIFTLVKEVFNKHKENIQKIYIKKEKKKNVLKNQVSKYFSVDPGKSSIYYNYLVQKENSIYEIFRIIKISKSINIELLEKSIHILLNMYPTLKSRFIVKNTGIVYQEYPVELSFSSIFRKINCKDIDLKEICNIFLKERFNMEKGPLFNIIHINNVKLDYNILIFKIHHIISDFWSIIIIYQNIENIYNNLLKNNSIKNIKIHETSQDVQNKNYKKYIQSNQFIEDNLFWKRYLSKYNLLENTNNIKRKNIQSFQFNLNFNFYNNLLIFSKKKKITPYTILLIIYQITFYRIYKRDYFITGTPVALRDDYLLRNYIGYCVNILPIVSDFSKQNDIYSFTEKVKNDIKNILQHKYFYFSKIIELLKLPRNTDYIPLFNSLFIYQTDHIGSFNFLNTIAANIKDSEFQFLGYPASIWYTNNFNLMHHFIFNISVNKESYSINIEYDENIHNKILIKKFSEQFKLTFQAIIFNKPKAIIEEKQYLFYQNINSTNKKFFKSQYFLDQLFRKQVIKNPNASAIIFNDINITYQKLNKYVNRVSHYLINHILKDEILIAILMDKGIEQIVACLAILSIGKAYLPININFSKNKIHEMMVLGKVKRFLTQKKYLKKFNFKDFQSIDVTSIIENSSFKESQEYFPKYQLRKLNDLAYVIFTSGSTGTPKGVMIEHKQVVNTILDINEKFQVNNLDRILAISNLDFDLSVYDIFGILSAGGTLVIVPSKFTKEPKYWLYAIQKYQITIWNSVPMFKQMFIEYLQGIDKESFYKKIILKLILLSGDWIPLDLPKKIFKIYKKNFDSLKVVSLGGATECSIWSNYFIINKNIKYKTSIPYGKPLSNQHLYILDALMLPTNILVPGYLYIGGFGVARGYWNDLKKTNESFYFHKEIGKRIYFTGDMGQYHPDGNIEFLGRKDRQIKINGYRIELEEIQNKLKSHVYVKDSFITVNQNNISAKILAFIILHNSSSMMSHTNIKKELKSFLYKNLSEYMIPNHFQFLKKFPLSKNGKIDENKLYKMHNVPILNIQKSANTKLQKSLKKIWKDLLKIKKDIYINDNFFQLGGSSLLAVRMTNLISKKLNLNIDVSAVFKYQTIESLEKFLQKDKIKIEKNNITKQERILYYE